MEGLIGLTKERKYRVVITRKQIDAEIIQLEKENEKLLTDITGLGHKIAALGNPSATDEIASAELKMLKTRINAKYAAIRQNEALLSQLRAKRYTAPEVAPTITNGGNGQEDTIPIEP